MTPVMVLYYLITGFLVVLLAWGFVREKRSRNDLVLYLLVIIPLILRLLRVK